jgi:hypothetical protein
LHLFLTGVEPSNGYTQVDVQIDDSLNQWWISSPYRETRFYQQGESDWVRTLPQDDFWGDPRAVQSGRLHFDYREADASAVEAIAPQMERVYLKLHRALGVEPATEMMTIAIVPDLPQWGALSAEYVEITSPTLSKIPVALSDADYLAHQVASQFTALAFERAVAGHPNLHLSRWQRMTWALRGWLRTDALGQRTPWHQQAEQIFAHRLAVEWPLRLRDLEDWNDAEVSTQEERMWQYVTSESLLRYSVETYGREIIPALLDGFGQYPTWKEVVPAVFQISSEEFERNYNRYLAERYELSPTLFAE